MAQKISVELVDDLDGSAASQTITFALDGKAYEIDLNDAHGQQLRADLSRWVAAGRRTGGRTQASRPRRAGADDTGAVRQWARDNGYTISDRGRIPAEVRRVYDEAH